MKELYRGKIFIPLKLDGTSLIHEGTKEDVFTKIDNQALSLKNELIPIIERKKGRLDFADLDIVYGREYALDLVKIDFFDLTLLEQLRVIKYLLISSKPKQLNKFKQFKK